MKIEQLLTPNSSLLTNRKTSCMKRIYFINETDLLLA